MIQIDFCTLDLMVTMPSWCNGERRRWNEMQPEGVPVRWVSSVTLVSRHSYFGTRVPTKSLAQEDLRHDRCWSHRGRLSEDLCRRNERSDADVEFLRRLSIGRWRRHHSRSIDPQTDAPAAIPRGVPTHRSLRLRSNNRLDQHK